MRKMTLAALAALSIAAGAVMLTSTAGAQEDVPEAGSAEAVAAPVAEVPPAPPDSTDDLGQRFSDLVRAYDALKSAQPGAKHLAIAGLIAAAAFFLVAVVKRFFASKKWIPWVLLTAGVVTGFTTSYASGVGLVVAVLYGAGPPAAVLLNELLKMFKKQPATT